MGVKQDFLQDILKNLSIRPTIGFVLLNGDWSMQDNRKSLPIYAQEYQSGHADPISAEDVNEENAGSGIISEGTMEILNAEQIRNIDLKTTLYLIPVSLNFTYKPLGTDKKVIPFIGGGFGFCIANRDVESRTLKEKNLNGPIYNLTFNNNQTVSGQLIQFFGGIEIPFQNNLKLVIEANTTLYSLNNFKPIVRITYTDASQQSLNWNKEDPTEIGVFDQQYISSLSIGLNVPF